MKHSYIDYQELALQEEAERFANKQMGGGDSGVAAHNVLLIVGVIIAAIGVVMMLNQNKNKAPSLASGEDIIL